MWMQLKKLWHELASRRAAAQAAQNESRIAVRGQKWIAPGESVKVLEIECNGELHWVALWSGKNSSQMIALKRGPATAGGASA